MDTYLFMPSDTLLNSTKPMTTFCCPIETEPKTMNQVELNQAREVAVGVIKDNKPSEASRILNEGMQPVIGVEKMANKLQGVDVTIEVACQCSVIATPTPDQCNLKEPLSAPF